MLSSAHDLPGLRLATASEGQELRVFAKSEEGHWRCLASWQVRAAAAAHARGRGCDGARGRSARGAALRHASSSAPQASPLKACACACGAQAPARKDAALRGVAWGNPRFGVLLASCADDGLVQLWRPADTDGARWALATSLGVEGAPPVLHVAFAPEAHGLLLAAACADGVVRVYQPADASGLAGWDLQARARERGFGAQRADALARLQSSFEAGPAGAACTALVWGPSSSGLPPTLAVAAGAAGVWAYAAELRRWQCACTLPASAGAVAGLAWAPTAGAAPATLRARWHVVHPHAARVAGRAWEMLASFSGSSVALWRLEFAPQPSEPLRAAVSAVAAPFVHPAPVCSADWNMFGNTLATAALDGRVRMWEAGLLGEWAALAECG